MATIYIPITDKPIPTTLVFGMDDKGFIAGIYMHPTTGKICNQAGQEYPNKIIFWLNPTIIPATKEDLKNENFQIVSMDYISEFPKTIDKIEDAIPNPDKELIREVVMRQGLAFPETEQDLKWSEQKPDHSLMLRLFNYLELGKNI